MEEGRAEKEEEEEWDRRILLLSFSGVAGIPHDQADAEGGGQEQRRKS